MTKIKYLTIIVCLSNLMSLVAQTRMESSLKENDGSQLWLPTINVSKMKEKTPQISYQGKLSKTISIAIFELQNAWRGQPIILEKTRGKKTDGFTISSSERQIQIVSTTDVGLLYGTYHLLRIQNTGIVDKNCSITETPFYELRILNHWDNLDGTIERGYAGKSLWNWSDLPDTLSPHYKEYARANASIGINGTVLNNVNASPEILSDNYLKKVKALANIFRPYGIRVYLSVNFASPIKLSGLHTADPLNKEVIQWWKKS